MKTATQALIGTGALALVFVLYFALQQGDQTRDDIKIEQREMKVESAQFDKEFAEMRAQISGKKLDQRKLDEHDKRIAAAEKELKEAKAEGSTKAQVSAEDLQGMREAFKEVK